MEDQTKPPVNEAPKPKPAKVDPLAGYHKITTFKGKFVKSSPITSVSEKWLTLHDGKTATYGYIQRYDVDFNQTGKEAKKGHLVFIDKDGMPIKNVTHFLP